MRAFKYILLTLILLFLFAPIIQYSTNLFSIRKLHGAIVPAKNTSFSWSAWFSGEYQEKKEAYKNETFGFRNMLVRLDHQIAFSFFKIAKANQVIIGKDNFIYEKAYIDTYFGRDFVGNDKMNQYADTLRQIKDSAAKKGKLLLFVFAPGKGSYYPEHIPDYLKSKKGPTNYEAMLASVKRAGIDYIDFNRYFMQQKEISPYPYYSQFGIHWSNYAMVHSFDSICSYIEKKTGKNLPDLKYTALELPDTLQEPDDDLLRGANILWYPKTFQMAYPRYEVVYDSTKHTKLNSVIISDSFWWQVYNSMLHAHTFEQYDYWYYCKQVYPESFDVPLTIDKVNYYERLDKADVIILLFTEPNLGYRGFGFAEIGHKVFCEPINEYEREIRKIKESMLLNKTWYTHLVKKSEETKLSLDSIINLDATFYYNAQHSKK